MRMLDMDIEWPLWSPPPDFIDKAAFSGLPRQEIGHCCKAGEHEVFGLLAALDHFLAEGDTAQHARWLTVCRQIVAGTVPAPGSTVKIEGADDVRAIPVVMFNYADLDQASRTRAAHRARAEPVHSAIDPLRPQCLNANPVCLRPEEIPRLIGALSSDAPPGEPHAGKVS